MRSDNDDHCEVVHKREDTKRAEGDGRAQVLVDGFKVVGESIRDQPWTIVEDELIFRTE